LPAFVSSSANRSHAAENHRGVVETVNPAVEPAEYVIADHAHDGRDTDDREREKEVDLRSILDGVGRSLLASVQKTIESRDLAAFSKAYRDA
jgi:hypothetical protein